MSAYPAIYLFAGGVGVAVFFGDFCVENEKGEAGGEIEEGKELGEGRGDVGERSDPDKEESIFKWHLPEFGLNNFGVVVAGSYRFFDGFKDISANVLVVDGSQIVRVIIDSCDLPSVCKKQKGTESKNSKQQKDDDAKVFVSFPIFHAYQFMMRVYGCVPVTVVPATPTLQQVSASGCNPVCTEIFLW